MEALLVHPLHSARAGCTLYYTGVDIASGCTVLYCDSSMDARYGYLLSLPLYSRDMARPPKSRARYPDIEKEYEVQDTLGSGEWRKEERTGGA